MNWSDVLADPSLQDLPYKIELNGYGQIVMTPASNRHARQQAEIAAQIAGLRTSGAILTECSIATSEGVKVADVAWMSDAFFAKHGETTPFSEAPELCVEVISPSNTQQEIQEKVRVSLYFEQGAKEVWLCGEEGVLEFFGPSGSIQSSGLFPAFPPQIA